MDVYIHICVHVCVVAYVISVLHICIYRYVNILKQMNEYVSDVYTHININTYIYIHIHVFTCIYNKGMAMVTRTPGRHNQYLLNSG